MKEEVTEQVIKCVFDATLSAPCTYNAGPSIVAGVWAAVVDVGLAVVAIVASNTCTPVSTGAIVSAGSSVLAGAAALTGEKVCACVHECVRVWEENRGIRSGETFLVSWELLLLQIHHQHVIHLSIVCAKGN